MELLQFEQNLDKVRGEGDQIRLLGGRYPTVPIASQVFNTCLMKGYKLATRKVSIHEGRRDLGCSVTMQVARRTAAATECGLAAVEEWIEREVNGYWRKEMLETWTEGQ